MHIEFNEKERRIINIIRGIMIVLVVFGHNYELPQIPIDFHRNEVLQTCIYYFNFYIVHASVPLFVLLSSILLYSKEYRYIDNIKKKFRSIFIPYILINTIWIIIFKVIEYTPLRAAVIGTDYQVYGIVDIIDCYIACFTRNMPIYYPFWFMKELIILNLIASVIKVFANKAPIIYGFLITLIAILNINVYIVGTRALFFWSLGYYVVKYYNQIKAFIKKFSTVIMLAIYFLSAVLVKLSGESIEFTYYMMYISFGLVLVKICTILLDSKMNITDINHRLLDTLAKYSTAIYFFHEFAEATLKKVAMTLIPQYLVVQISEYVLIPCIVILFCITFAYFMQKYMPRTYKIITGGR